MQGRLINAEQDLVTGRAEKKTIESLCFCTDMYVGAIWQVCKLQAEGQSLMREWRVG